MVKLLKKEETSSSTEENQNASTSEENSVKNEPSQETEVKDEETGPQVINTSVENEYKGLTTDDVDKAFEKVELGGNAIGSHKTDTEKRRQELESSREIETLYDLTKPIAEDSEEVVSKIEKANKLRKEAKVKSEQAAKETNEEKRIALNSDAGNLNEKAQILDKEVKASRNSVIRNTPIKQAINSANV